MAIGTHFPAVRPIAPTLVIKIFKLRTALYTTDRLTPPTGNLTDLSVS
ncbi:MAG TPA: hypothetical protein V6D27_11415 [Vampirovibrionales bacterium]